MPAATLSRWFVCVAVLLICLVYASAAVFQAPYPGLGISPNWMVRSLAACENDAICRASNQESVYLGDQILAIGELDWNNAQRNRGRVPFGGYAAGERVTLTLERAGETLTAEWVMLGPTLAEQLRRLAQVLLLFLPFWVAGTITLWFLQSRAQNGHLMIAFFYFSAIWLAVGSFAELRVLYTLPTQRALAWLLAPLYLHVHLVVPTSILPRLRRILPGMYGIAGVLAVLELLQWVPDGYYNLGLLVAVGGSLLLLLWRLWSSKRPRKPRQGQLAASLMLAGVALSLGPGILVDVIPALVGNPLRDEAFPIHLALLTIPILPAFYLYAVYKSALGKLEVRYHRLLGHYTFALLYLVVILLMFRISSHLFENGWLLYALLGAAFGLIGIPAHSRLMRLLEQLSYGTTPDPQVMVYTFADHLPATLEHGSLANLLIDKILPQLDVYQSALYRIQENGIELVYAQGVAPELNEETTERLKTVLMQHGTARHLYGGPQPFSWVQVSLPLQIREKPVGVWLFGKRGTDNFYPKHVIQLLETMGKQIAVALENRALFLAQEEQARDLEQSLNRLQDTQAQLIQTGKLASLGTFVAGMAHELDTPLATTKILIRTIKTALRKKRLTEAMLGENLEYIEQVTNKAADVVQRLLLFARASPAEHQTLDINHILQEALGMVEVQLRLHEIQVSLELNTDLPTIQGNSTQLEQVIINLIGNAHDAMLATMERRKILTLRTFYADKFVCLEVCDTGVGIPSVELDRIFDPFYTTKAPGKGTGLGLSVSYGIVREHGGELMVESNVGTGTTFLLELPVADSESKGATNYDQRE